MNNNVVCMAIVPVLLLDKKFISQILLKSPEFYNVKSDSIIEEKKMQCANEKIFIRIHKYSVKLLSISCIKFFRQLQKMKLNFAKLRFSNGLVMLSVITEMHLFSSLFYPRGKNRKFSTRANIAVTI